MYLHDRLIGALLSTEEKFPLKPFAHPSLSDLNTSVIHLSGEWNVARDPDKVEQNLPMLLELFPHLKYRQNNTHSLNQTLYIFVTTPKQTTYRWPHFFLLKFMSGTLKESLYQTSGSGRQATTTTNSNQRNSKNTIHCKWTACCHNLSQVSYSIIQVPQKYADLKGTV